MGGPYWDQLAQFLLAIRDNNVQLANLLMQTGVDCDSRFRIGSAKHPTICICVECGHVQMVKLLLEWGCSVNQAVDVSGRTALHIAASSGYMTIARMLLHRRAQLDIRDVEGMTPLHLAAQRMSLEMVELLVTHGASVDALDNSSRTPLMHSVCYKNPAITRYLLDNLASVGAADSTGNTALHYAAAASELDMDLFQRLVARAEGQSKVLDAINRHGQQALHYLAGRPASPAKWAVLDMLLNAGCQVERSTPLGQTALHLASISPPDERSAETLVLAGCPVDTRDELGLSPLATLLKGGGSGDIVRLLLAAGGDPKGLPDGYLEAGRSDARDAIVEARRRRVPTLAESCRVAMWRQYGGRTLGAARLLGLPGPILRFLGYDR